MKTPSNTLLAATALGAVAVEKMKEMETGLPAVGTGAAGAARDLRAEAGLEMQAHEHCKYHAPREEFPPQLIEGHLEGCVVEVPMPNGETWRYTMPQCPAAPCPVLVCIMSPSQAHVFRPSAEGVHPFLRTVRRFGVDQMREGGVA